MSLKEFFSLTATYGAQNLKNLQLYLEKSLRGTGFSAGPFSLAGEISIIDNRARSEQNYSQEWGTVQSSIKGCV